MSDVKAAQLGMPIGTASARLKKSILFRLLQRLGEDVCFRCFLQITTVDDLSVEHKRAWLHVDVALFWDLDNIAFSHLSCNSGSGIRHKAEHGTDSKYESGCRCADCTRAGTEARMDRYRRNGRKSRRKVLSP